MRNTIYTIENIRPREATYSVSFRKGDTGEKQTLGVVARNPLAALARGARKAGLICKRISENTWQFWIKNEMSQKVSMYYLVGCHAVN